MNIKSSRISAVEYNDTTEVLTIYFVRGGRYKYYKVPESIYKGILKSASPGNYFDMFIKPNYMSKKE